MSEQRSSLEVIAERRARREAEKSKLSYESYVRNLKTLVEENHEKISGSITKPQSNAAHEYVCIREPLEFISLFQGCSGQEEQIGLFVKLLQDRDIRVVEQVIGDNIEAGGCWFNSTTNGINLRPGLRDEEWSSPVSVVLGDDAVHGLVAGRTGSGKSVFLNNLIFSLVSEYAPWELNLFLADFKKVEFSRYLSKYHVPHIKAVAATSEIRYVVSLLTYLANCMNARQNFFALLGLQKLSDLREKYEIVLPRVLLIVDEFQQLFLEATSREQMVIEDLITSITKLGRATGYHLLFASQEMSGTMGASVFANFHARFALACESDISSRILGNSAAAKIDKKGIVIARMGEGKEEGNEYFKVPFIPDVKDSNYFYEYLAEITDYGENCGFQSVHKFYQEDSIKNISDLEHLLNGIRDTRKHYLEESGSGLIDILTLGEAVVFNYRKYDYETVFLERGVRKNIGVFSPSVDDTAYVCKLLATNFNTSPNAEKYNHYIFARNDLFMKKINLGKELNVGEGNIQSSIDFLEEITGIYQRRSGEAALLNRYSQYHSLKDFAFDGMYLQEVFFVGEDGVTDDDKETLRALSAYFDKKQVKDIPAVENEIMEEYDFHEDFFRVLDLLYEKETSHKTVAELFDMDIFWIIGAEMVGKFPREMEAVLADATNYNMLFVIVASNDDFGDFYMLHKTCDYIFVSGNNESYYNKLRIPFTKKSENSISVDFSIMSMDAQRSFKKFHYDLEKVIVREIDFDKILG